MGNFEFGNVKSIRKSLLISSVLTIFLVRLTSYSSGKIKLIGFEVPLNEAGFLPRYMAFMILFFIIALLIRFQNEKFMTNYRKNLERATGKYSVRYINDKEQAQEEIKRKTKSTRKFFKYSIFTLDILFPIIMGIGTIIYVMSTPLLP